MVDIKRIETELEELAVKIKVLSNSREQEGSSEVDELIAALKAEVRIRELSIAYLDLG